MKHILPILIARFAFAVIFGFLSKKQVSTPLNIFYRKFEELFCGGLDKPLRIGYNIRDGEATMTVASPASLSKDNRCCGRWAVIFLFYLSHQSSMIVMIMMVVIQGQNGYYNSNDLQHNVHEILPSHIVHSITSPHVHIEEGKRLPLPRGILYTEKADRH
jgi:hypothetical protein